jgi:hypothetical protein
LHTKSQLGVDGPELILHFKQACDEFVRELPEVCGLDCDGEPNVCVDSVELTRIGDLYSFYLLLAQEVCDHVRGWHLLHNEAVVPSLNELDVPLEADDDDVGRLQFRHSQERSSNPGGEIIVVFFYDSEGVGKPIEAFLTVKDLCAHKGKLVCVKV